jgi:hypothetical protein
MDSSALATIRFMGTCPPRANRRHTDDARERSSPGER